MPNQKSILVKLDHHNFVELEAECKLGWMKRNRHINEAVRLYIDYKDTQRMIRVLGTPEEKRECLHEFRKKWFPMVRW